LPKDVAIISPVKFPDFPNKKVPYLREPALEAMLRKLIGVVTVVCSYGREWENGLMIHCHWFFFPEWVKWTN